MTLLGATIVRLAARVFGDDVASRVFEPLVADWQRELAARTGWGASAKSMLRGVGALTITVVSTALRLTHPTRHDSHERRATLRVFAIFVGLSLLLALMPLALALAQGTAIRSAAPLALLFMVLMNPMVSVIAPVAIVPAAIRSGTLATRTVTPRMRLFVVVLAVTVLSVTLALVGWGQPWVWGQVREASLARPLALEPIWELSLPELWTSTRPDIGDRALNREIWRRVTLAVVWPATLAVFGWRLGRHRRSSGPFVLGAWWFAAGLAHLFGLTLLRTNVDGVTLLWQSMSLPSVWLVAATALTPRREVLQEAR